MGKALISISNLEGTKRGTVSAFGRFMFENIPVGEYQVKAEQEGYLTQTESIVVRSNGTNELEFNLIPENIEISVMDSLLVAPIASFYKLNVQSNSSWRISDTEEWIRADITTGGGNMEVGVDIQENFSTSSRFGTIIIQEETTVRRIIVEQPPAIRVTDFKIKRNNFVSDAGSEIEISFNQNITIEEAFIETSNSFCEPLDLTAVSANTISFSSKCYYSFGKGCNFIVLGRYSEGTIFKDTVAYNFYTDKIMINGDINESYVDDVSSSFWVRTSNPDRVYQISQENLSIIQQIEPNLPNRIVKMAVNHQDQELIIVDSRVNIIVFDLSSGQQLRKVIIPNEIDGVRKSELGTPIKLLYTNNGTGLMLFNKLGSDRPNLFFIDENTDQKLTLPDETKHAEEITDIALSRDRTKGYILNGSIGNFMVYDEKEKLFSKMELDVNKSYTKIWNVNRVNNSFVSIDEGLQFNVTDLDKQPISTYLLPDNNKLFEFDYSVTETNNFYSFGFNNFGSTFNYFNAELEEISASYFFLGGLNSIVSDLSGEKLTILAELLEVDHTSILYQVPVEYIEK